MGSITIIFIKLIPNVMNYCDNVIFERQIYFKSIEFDAFEI